MAENHRNAVAAVVLAGGASSRMGQPKALMPFAGEPLAAWALRRLRPQAGVVYLNVREPAPAYAAFDAPLVPDSPRWRGAGPLAGVAAALARAKADGFAWLATAPCDAPFLPLDFVARLVASLGPRASRAPAVGTPAVQVAAAVAQSASGLEPMFALWPVDALGAVEAALEAGRASPRAVLQHLGATQAAFPIAEGRDPLANLNTPREFAVAEALALRLLLEADRPAPAGAIQGDGY